jgi:hypothetical protein
MIHHKKLKFVLELTDDRIKGKLGKPFGKKKGVDKMRSILFDRPRVVLGSSDTDKRESN